MTNISAARRRGDSANAAERLHQCNLLKTLIYETLSSHPRFGTLPFGIEIYTKIWKVSGARTRGTLSFSSETLHIASWFTVSELLEGPIYVRFREDPEDSNVDYSVTERPTFVPEVSEHDFLRADILLTPAARGSRRSATLPTPPKPISRSSITALPSSTQRPIEGRVAPLTHALMCSDPEALIQIRLDYGVSPEVRLLLEPSMPLQIEWDFAPERLRLYLENSSNSTSLLLTRKSTGLPDSSARYRLLSSLDTADGEFFWFQLQSPLPDLDLSEDDHPPGPQDRVAERIPLDEEAEQIRAARRSPSRPTDHDPLDDIDGGPGPIPARRSDRLSALDDFVMEDAPVASAPPMTMDQLFAEIQRMHPYHVQQAAALLRDHRRNVKKFANMDQFRDSEAFRRLAAGGTEVRFRGRGSSKHDWSFRTSDNRVIPFKSFAFYSTPDSEDGVSLEISLEDVVLEGSTLADLLLPSSDPEALLEALRPVLLGLGYTPTPV